MNQPMEEMPYVWRWRCDKPAGRWHLRLQGRKGQRCRVLARLSRNSAVVEFADGYQVITSRNALRKAKPDE